MNLGKPSTLIGIGLLWAGSLFGAYLLGGKTQPSGDVRPGAERAATGGAAGSLYSAPGDTGSPADDAAKALSATGRGDRDPVRALLGFAEMGADDDLPQSLRELAGAMDIEQVNAALAELEKLDGSPSKMRAFKAVLSRWAQLEPTDAFGYVAAMDQPKARFDAKLWVLKSWGETAPAEALAFLKENPDSSISRYAANAVFDGLANGDLNVAMSFLENLNEDDTPYGGATYSAVRELFDRNDREVISWAEGLPAGEVRDRAIYAVLDQWARYDPLAAKAWLEKSAGGRNLPEAQVELGESWARVDPEAALKWASGLDTDAKNADRVKQRIFNRWMQYDFESAANFLVEQEPSPQMDSAFEMYIQKARHYDPEATMVWAESITDEKRRTRAIYSVASVWKGRDRAAWDNYVETTGFGKKKPTKKLQ